MDSCRPLTLYLRDQQARCYCSGDIPGERGRAGGGRGERERKGDGEEGERRRERGWGGRQAGRQTKRWDKQRQTDRKRDRLTVAIRHRQPD